jgi:UDP-N-acetylmuramoylalanine--D-glutamate ligase
MDTSLAGRRVTVMGLGTHGGGVGVTRYLAAQGAHVTVTDRASADALRDSLQALRSLPLAAVHLGPHQAEDFADTELLVVNPAVHHDDPWVALARSRGIPVSSEIELLLDSIPCPALAVTGSNGKSTTVTLSADMLRAAGRQVWLGGNLGGSLLSELPNMQTADLVVLELSSFQLHWLRPKPDRFTFGVVTNCTPNHLDWHRSFEHYACAKRTLLTSSTQIVLDPSLPTLSAWGHELPAKLLPLLPDDQLPPLTLPGPHNRHNARLAATAAMALRASETAIAQALRDFTPLPHRIQPIADVAGRTFYDDSKSTTPEATWAALHALKAPVWLLIGGVDKGADWATCVGRIPAHVRGVVSFGQSGPMLDQLVNYHAPAMKTIVARDLRSAFAQLWPLTSRGDAILLSPGCASFDQYTNYVARANDFRQIVSALASANSQRAFLMR